jgi:hypothetical protein
MRLDRPGQDEGARDEGERDDEACRTHEPLLLKNLIVDWAPVSPVTASLNPRGRAA